MSNSVLYKFSIGSPVKGSTGLGWPRYVRCPLLERWVSTDVCARMKCRCSDIEEKTATAYAVMAKSFGA